MKTNKLLLPLFIIGIFFLIPAESDAQLNFADYAPISLGSYAIFQNTANPLDIYTDSVFECFIFNNDAGQPVPACKIGSDEINYGILNNDGTALIYYAYSRDGIIIDFPDVSVGDFTDCTLFNVASPTNFKLLREWDNLDPELKSVYNIDPELNNLVLEATYDSDYQKNSQNTIVESNCDSPIPDYAVTALTWYAPGTGTIVELDVSAQSGELNERYDRIDYFLAPRPDIKANSSDVPVSINTGDNLNLSISLGQGTLTSTDTDWWVMANTPFGWYYYNLSSGWQSGTSVTYMGPLLDLSPYEILNTTLPAGSYTFYFGVDTNMNGSIDMGQIYYDTVNVIVGP